MSKVTPWSAINVFTFGMTRIDSTVWSSVSKTMTFGRIVTSDLPAEAAPFNAPAEAIPAARAARTIQRVEAAMSGSLPGKREGCVRGL